MNISHASTEGLVERTREVQSECRSRPVQNGDLFLVTQAPRDDVCGPTEVAIISDEDYDGVMRKLAVGYGRAAHQVINGVLTRQLPSSATVFTANLLTKKQAATEICDASRENRDPVLPPLPSRKMLPGGIPIIDHVMMRVQNTPDWLMFDTSIKKLQDSRLPVASFVPAPWVVTIGSSSLEEVDRVIEHIRSRVEEVKRTMTFCMCSLDVECVAVASMQGEEYYPGKLRLRLAKPRESAKQFPTKLMIGHVDWHINLVFQMAPSPSKDDHLNITVGLIQADRLRTLFSLFPIVCGVRVAEDIDIFNATLVTLYGSSAPQLKPHIVDLAVLAKYAGINTSRTALGVLNWLTFGTIMPKGECSCADGKWWKRWRDLEDPFKAYLYGDITRAAAIGWTLTLAWVIHMFPDVHAVASMSNLHNVTLPAWWVEKVVINLPLISGRENVFIPVQESRDALLSMLVGADSAVVSAAVRGLNPDWPDASAGGPRFLHSARAFLVSKVHLLANVDPATWRPPQASLATFIMLGRDWVRTVATPTAAVMGMSWVANPGTEKRLKGPLEEVTERAVSQVTGAGVTQRSAVLELARLDFNTGIEILLKMEKGEGHFQQVTRSKKLARQMVHDLRALFASCQLIPDRDPGWVDHWALDTRKLENVARARMEEARRQESRALALSAQALQGQVSARNLISNLRDVAVGDAVIPDLAAVPRGPAGQFMPVGRVPAGYVDQLGGRGGAETRRSRPAPSTATSGEFQAQQRQEREKREGPLLAASRDRSRSPIRIPRHQVQSDLRQVLDARRSARPDSPDIQIIMEIPAASRRAEVLPRSYRRSLDNAMYGNGGNFTLEGGSPRASSGEVRTVRVLSQEEETRIREEDWEPPVPANRIPVVTGISRNTRRRRAMLDYDSSSH